MERSYNFSPDFERAVAALSATSPEFFGKAGTHIRPDKIVQEDCRLLIRAAQEIARDLGRGPSQGSIVLQRIRRWVEHGKTAESEWNAAALLLVEVPPPALDEVLCEIVPILREEAETATLIEIMDARGKRKDLAPLVEKLSKAERLGIIDTSVGTMLGMASLSEIERLNALDRIPTGVMELDAALDGGVSRGQLAFWMSGTSGGKSMALVQCTTQCLLQGGVVAYATLELSRALTKARLVAHLTGVPINEVVAQPHGEAEKRLAEILPKIGTCVVEEFPAGTTTVPDLDAWLDRVAEQVGRPVDMVAVDYADKLASHKRNKFGDEQSAYKGMETVYETLRLLAHRRGIWCWTASQARRRGAKERGLTLENEDVSDSVHKVRVADVVISINNEQGQEAMLSFFIAKNRTGRALMRVGPVPHDFACGRLCPP